jgi:hypothetical protein
MRKDSPGLDTDLEPIAPGKRCLAIPFWQKYIGKARRDCNTEMGNATPLTLSIAS